MEDIVAVFAKNLKKFRNSREMTQEKLSEYTGLSIGYIARLETEKNWPSEDTVKKISKVLNIDECLFFLPENVEESLRKFVSSPSKEELAKLVEPELAFKILLKAKNLDFEALKKIVPPKLALKILEKSIRQK